ncbi:MAG: CBS domain-containing protein [Polyangiaceae bacterium]
MTPCPYTAHLRDTVLLAREVMLTHRIRHLPIVDAGKPRGMVLDHQLHAGVPPETLLSTVMVAAYAADENTRLTEVLSEMTARRSDVAVVTRQGSVVGVFTAVDAMRLLRALVDRDA